MEQRRSDRRKENIKKNFAAVTVAVIVLMIVAFFVSRKAGNKEGTFSEAEVSYEVKNGRITADGKTSGMKEAMFLIKDGTVYINLTKLGECISLDVIANTDGYVIRSPKIQLTLCTNGTVQLIDGSGSERPQEDSKPVISDGSFFSDSDRIFHTFGYKTAYQTSVDNKSVELFLDREEENQYDTIEVIAEEKPADAITETGEAPQLGAPSDDGTLPKVSEVDPVGNGDIQTPDDSVMISDKEADELWKEKKSTISSVFKGATPLPGSAPYRESSDGREISFNPMTGGVYYDTLNITDEPVGEDSVLLKASFSGDWSDYAANTPVAGAKAYYNSLPAVYEATIKSLLGPEEGERFFSFIKNEADRMTKGGYILVWDENGTLQSQWTDDYVGDGVGSSVTSYADWQGQATDDGLRYNVSRNGNGFTITIYKIKK